MKDLLLLFRRYGASRFTSYAISELIQRIWSRMVLGSYSQSDEDRIIDKLLKYKKRGFYVDVGAFDPYRFSNTMRFYRRGWHGINIEPDRERWSRFQKTRKRDINLNIGIGGKKGSITYYRIDPPTLSTFEPRQAAAYEKQGFSLLGKVKVDVLPLRDVLGRYVKRFDIDFMSIDVEGMEMQVLASNDWNAFRPRVICIESVDYSKTKEGKRIYEDIGILLKNVGYTKACDNSLNSFYKDAHE